VTASLLDRNGGLLDGVYTVTHNVAVPADTAVAIARELETIGGSYRWYGAGPAWALRVALGHLVGERLRLRRAPILVEDASVDWWRVARSGPGFLVLRSDGWVPGDAWLGYRAEAGRLHQVAAFRPKGVPGFLYWKLLVPVHRIAFRVMAHRRAGVRH
jgi:hypothetical protein